MFHYEPGLWTLLNNCPLFMVMAIFGHFHPSGAGKLCKSVITLIADTPFCWPFTCQGWQQRNKPEQTNPEKKAPIDGPSTGENTDFGSTLGFGSDNHSCPFPGQLHILSSMVFGGSHNLPVPLLPVPLPVSLSPELQHGLTASWRCNIAGLKGSMTTINHQ